MLHLILEKVERRVAVGHDGRLKHIRPLNVLLPHATDLTLSHPQPLMD